MVRKAKVLLINTEKDSLVTHVLYCGTRCHEEGPFNSSLLPSEEEEKQVIFKYLFKKKLPISVVQPEETKSSIPNTRKRSIETATAENKPDLQPPPVQKIPKEEKETNETVVIDEEKIVQKVVNVSVDMEDIHGNAVEEYKLFPELEGLLNSIPHIPGSPVKLPKEAVRSAVSANDAWMSMPSIDMEEFNSLVQFSDNSI